VKRGFEWLVVGAALLGAPGCAAGAPPPASAPRAEAIAPPAPVVVVAEAPAPPPSPAAMAVATGRPSEADERGAASRAGVDLVAAQRELEMSAGNCTVACRALGSMDRAAGQLCGLAATREDVRVCDESKEKLVAARARVRAACGSCPGGPSVDPNAPVPSP